MWKQKDRAMLDRAIGHANWTIEDGRIVGENIPDDVAKIVHGIVLKDAKDRTDARKAQLSGRAVSIDKYRDAFRLADVVIVAGKMKFGGDLPEEITPRDPELLLWGIWLRDMKRAIDRGPGVPALIPFPPLPSWIDINPGVAGLCDRLGVSRE